MIFSYQKACPHQLEIAKYPAIWTIPIANYPVNLSLHQPEVAISGIFGQDNHPKISWASLQNIPLFVWCVFTSPNTRIMRERWAKYLELQVSRSNLKLMKTQFVTSGLYPKSEMAAYLAISSWCRQAYSRIRDSRAPLKQSTTWKTKITDCTLFFPSDSNWMWIFILNVASYLSSDSFIHLNLERHCWTFLEYFKCSSSIKAICSLTGSLLQHLTGLIKHEN